MIGARMENEGTEILDTEPDEAKLLIGMIEALIETGTLPGKIGEDDYRRSGR